jgi:hypothetical protein
VSLILDALRKLQREKDAPDPGVLVVGPVPWGREGRRGRPVLLGGLALVAGVAAVVAWLFLRSGPEPSAAVEAGPEVVSSPTPEAGPIPNAPSPAAEGSPAALPAPPPERRIELPGSTEAPPTASAPGEAARPSRGSGRLEAEDLHLNAVSQKDGRPVALINDRLVFEGDSFDGVRVVRIGEAEVEVEIRGRRHVLHF